MTWHQGAQNIKLSNRKLKSALKYIVWSQYMPIPERRTDRRTDEHHGNTRRIVLRTHRAL